MYIRELGFLHSPYLFYIFLVVQVDGAYSTCAFSGSKTNNFNNVQYISLIESDCLTCSDVFNL